MGHVTETKEFNMTKDKNLKVFCSKCHRATNHVVLQSVDYDGSEVFYDDYGVPDAVIGWSDNYQIIQCKGCDDITFRHESYFSEDMETIGPGDDNLSDGKTIRLYPKRSDETRTVKDFYYVPPKLRRIYRETIDCFNNDALTLCAAGLRAIIEGICADQGISKGPVTIKLKDGSTKIETHSNLEGKIAGLCEKGILTQASTEILHEHRSLGNDAVHELDQPSTAELGYAIDIIELTLETLYELPEKADSLRSLKAKRKRG